MQTVEQLNTQHAVNTHTHKKTFNLTNWLIDWWTTSSAKLKAILVIVVLTMGCRAAFAIAGEPGESHIKI